ncbi:hypothetical protein [Planctomycetes bacterium TBK1r]|uniref:Uncharacterized protein n=1 Tax=Stieleria magnilauensis TaxID=2527963 RepID=A0ABX5XYZ2_9BACT|nr:hypothetical protein TBK1r_59300 [Planctomycetes bacterium TBK1r]QDV86981.1 hypothetical protein TBK1r_60080 [Planctomycetes bacterium TBK1r]
MDAGKINAEWMRNAQNNETTGSTIADWFIERTNSSVEIDEDGSVWVYDSQSWLSQERIDEICREIDAAN